jgi:hypothetical protein
MAASFMNYRAEEALALMYKREKCGYAKKAGQSLHSYRLRIQVCIWQLMKEVLMRPHFHYFAILQPAGTLINFMYLQCGWSKT